MAKRIIIYTLLTLSIQLNIQAQYYNTGQDPASLKWNIIKTEHFRFIYPSSYEKQAQKTASVFEDSYKLVKGRYNDRELKRFPVILHNHTVESNGYVTWAPKRVELYPFPGQNSIPLSHPEQLALHELVHVSQMQGLRNGLSKPLEILLGEQYPGALSIFTPFWFLEGDAVVSESIFSLSGRGRQPAFEKSLKAMLLEKGTYSYDQMINGSYKNYTPDHYRFGYQMTAYALWNIDKDLFKNAVSKTAALPFSLNPFNMSFRKDGATTKKKLYYSTMNYLSKEWTESDSLLFKSSFDYFSPDTENEFISYHSPVVAGKDSVLAVKVSFSDPPAIVLLSDKGKTEEHIHTPGYMWPYSISYSKGILVWAEQKTDPRWTNREYSVIESYDLKTGLVTQLSQNTRFFSPSISKDSKRIVVVESTADYENFLVLIDRFNGEELSRIKTPRNELPVFPEWDTKDQKIAFISYTDMGEGIMIFNTESVTWEYRLAESREDLHSVQIRNDTVFFIGSGSGIDNIYSVSPEGHRDLLSSSRFGVEDLSLWDNKLLFSDYSANGNRIAISSLGNILERISSIENSSGLQIKKIDSKNKLISYEGDENDIPYKSSTYRKWKHLFNFHSWMPFYADVNNLSFDNIAVSPGATIMSQNHLSTLTTTLAYEYIDGDHLLHSNLSWRGWYPAIDLNITYGGLPRIVQDKDSIFYPQTVNPGLKVSTSIYLPLRFRYGKFSQTFWPSLSLLYRNNYVFEEGTGKFDYGQIFASTRLYFSNLHRLARRDIWPRWGQIIDFNRTFAPGDNQTYGPISTFKSTLYAPGLVKNHALKLRYQYEKQDFKKLFLYNRITLPRGYNGIISGKINSFSADYALPLFYPDLNLGSLIYLTRIRSTLFYDIAAGTNNYHIDGLNFVHEEEKFESYGLELLADFYLLRIPFKFSSGVQAAWLPGKQDAYFNFLLTMDVFGFVIGEKARYR